MLFQQLNTRAVHALDGFIQLKLLPKVLGPYGGITQCRHVHPLNSSCARCQLSSLRSLEYFLRGRNHSKELSAGLAPPARKTANFLKSQRFCTHCFISCLQVPSHRVQIAVYIRVLPADPEMAKPSVSAPPGEHLGSNKTVNGWVLLTKPGSKQKHPCSHWTFGALN